MFTQDEVRELLLGFPPVDVFIAHNSPLGIHERDATIHQGFAGFLSYIDEHQPAYFLHGHQHCNQVTLRGATNIVGVYGERHLQIQKN